MIPCCLFAVHHGTDNFPLVELQLDKEENNPTAATCDAVTAALRDSGFLLVKTSLLPLELQQRALKSADKFLNPSRDKVVSHPSDPKIYAMLEGIHSFSYDSDTDPTIVKDLEDWYHALRKTRDVLLHCIADGLGMDDPNFFVKLHNGNNDAVRLLKYHPGDATTGNRCKEHSDYGTLTLLMNDGIGGLEAFIDGEWKPVPYVEGCVVVNIGSLLSEWTRQELKATLHRVAGPASIGINTSKDVLLKAASVPRVSIAYFADPNLSVSTTLMEKGKNSAADDVVDDNGSSSKMSVSQYIQWRSGGNGDGRSGVAFTSIEESRLGFTKTKILH